MKSKKGYVVLQISVFLGLLAFIGLMIFEIEIDKKKFIDASVNKNEEVEENKNKIGIVMGQFKEAIEVENLTKEQLEDKYSLKSYESLNIIIKFDKEKNLFVARAMKDQQKLGVVYYDYEVELFKDNDIIEIVKFYEV
ncbi:MAG: hypothetical protein ACRCWM_05765 [Sarcina sp.]